MPNLFDLTVDRLVENTAPTTPILHGDDQSVVTITSNDDHSDTTVYDDDSAPHTPVHSPYNDHNHEVDSPVPVEQEDHFPDESFHSPVPTRRAQVIPDAPRAQQGSPLIVHLPILHFDSPENGGAPQPVQAAPATKFTCTTTPLIQESLYDPSLELSDILPAYLRSQKWSDDQVSELCDPLLYSVFSNPVVASDGYTYDLDSLEAYAKTKADHTKIKCPMNPNLTLESRVIPNFTVQRLINGLISEINRKKWTPEQQDQKENSPPNSSKKRQRSQSEILTSNKEHCGESSTSESVRLVL